MSSYTSLQSCCVTLSSGKKTAMAARVGSFGCKFIPMNINDTAPVLPPPPPNTRPCTNKSSSTSDDATTCHFSHNFATMADLPLFTTLKTVTLSGTSTSPTFHPTMAPQVPPPPPRTAQNTSSPIARLSSTRPLPSTIRTSTTLSEERPYFLARAPYPPPEK